MYVEDMTSTMISDELISFFSSGVMAELSPLFSASTPVKANTTPVNLQAETFTLANIAPREKKLVVESLPVISFEPKKKELTHTAHNEVYTRPILSSHLHIPRHIPLARP